MKKIKKKKRKIRKIKMGLENYSRYLTKEGISPVTPIKQKKELVFYFCNYFRHRGVITTKRRRLECLERKCYDLIKFVEEKE